MKKRVEELDREAIQWKRAEDQVAELERSKEKLRQFVYIASCDLQRQLDNVMRYLRFVEARYKDRLDSDAKAFIASAVEGATRMQSIITDLMTYSDGSRRKGES